MEFKAVKVDTETYDRIDEQRGAATKASFLRALLKREPDLKVINDRINALAKAVLEELVELEAHVDGVIYPLIEHVCDLGGKHLDLESNMKARIQLLEEAQFEHETVLKVLSTDCLSRHGKSEQGGETDEQ